jgi:3-phenylpropionate/cinnamic acid dioxygenase small subunit
MPANPAAGLAASTRTGRDEILEGVRERRAAGLQGPGTETRHVLSTMAVDVRGDSATARSYFTFYTQTASSPVLFSMGQYDDVFRLTADGWKLAHRVITMG